MAASTAESSESRSKNFSFSFSFSRAWSGVETAVPFPSEAAAAKEEAAAPAAATIAGATAAAYSGTATSLRRSTKYGESSAAPRSAPRLSSVVAASAAARRSFPSDAVGGGPNESRNRRNRPRARLRRRRNPELMRTRARLLHPVSVRPGSKSSDGTPSEATGRARRWRLLRRTWTRGGTRRRGRNPGTSCSATGRRAPGIYRTDRRRTG